MTLQTLRLQGVRTHNLQDVSLELPLGALICITGVSGSGKSSLAFDTLCQEARRRYFDVLRLTEGELPVVPPPPLKEASGLPPAVGLEQKIPRLNWRSTVGTFTGLLDFLRVLFAELGRLRCPRCGFETRPQPLFQVLEEVQSLPEGTKLYVLAPLPRPHPEALRYLVGEGFSRFLLDGQVVDLLEEPPPTEIHTASILVDRLVVQKGREGRLEEALRLASQLAGGVIKLHLLQRREDLVFTTAWRCPSCGEELPKLRPEHFSFNHPLGACPKCSGLGQVEEGLCPECQGQRLSSWGRAVTLAGKTLPALGQAPLEEFASWLEGLAFAGFEGQVLHGLRKEIQERLQPLLDLDLGYLSLFHPGPALSSGELQKVRLASLLGERLSGCLYVLDEPALALSPPEKERLLLLLRRLQAQGNTVIIVEHDPLLITSVDLVVELGPGAGSQGGKVLFVGPPEEMLRQPELPSGAFLAGKQRLQRQRRTTSSFVEFEGLRIPLGVLNVLCGPTGSGKTRWLQRFMAHHPEACLVTPAEGKGKESFVLSFIGAFKALREFLAQTKEARLLGLRPTHFSPFTSQGRCPGCKGKGQKTVEIPLLPPLKVVCEECQGTGLCREALKVKYRGYNLKEIFEMTVEEALPLLGRHPLIKERLSLLEEVGLGYLRLGQALTSLSGGERQRLRLARLLLAREAQLLLLDLPTLGLHLADVERLLQLFDRLLEGGKTIVVADNHPALVLLADHLFEMERGHVAWSGPVEEWLASRDYAKSYERYQTLVKSVRN